MITIDNNNKIYVTVHREVPKKALQCIKLYHQHYKSEIDTRTMIEEMLGCSFKDAFELYDHLIQTKYL